MPIELDNTSINVINGADTFQVDFVKSKGSYTEKAAESATYSCGYNYYGQLGHGNTSNKNTPTLIQYFINNKITISYVSAGVYHSIFLDTNGNVYSCGDGYYGQLGHGNTSNKNTPTLIQYFDTNSISISQVYGNIYHSIFLDTNGYVYTCGYGGFRQLGHGDSSSKNTPTLIETYIDSNGNNINYTDITISQISGGERHSIFLDTNGNVYTCGGGYHGQLGHGDTSDKNTPTLIQYFDTNSISISQIYGNIDHSLFLDTNGNVYSCGENIYGQLGHGNTSDTNTPTLIQYFVTNSISISYVSAGGYHSIFLATNANVYTCGAGNYGQLGHGNTSNNSTPTLIQYFDTNSISISHFSGGELHSIFLDTNGNVYSCGRNNYGQLGHGDTSDKSTPTLIQYFVTNNITISQIFSNGSYSIFFSNDPYYATIEYPAQWTYSSSDASVYYLDNVGIGTYPSNTKILNVHNGINFTGDLYINNSLFDTPKYKHTHIHENNYLPDIVPNISPTYIPNSNEYQIYSFVYDDSNNNGNGQTEYTINFHQETECDILIVGGGGAGGYDRAGGGGAGGLVFQKNVSLTGQVNIKVGKGGVINSNDLIPGGNGSNSSINDIIALGGGGGAGEASVASDGGSGGGSSYSYSASHFGAGLQPTQTPNIGYGNRGGDARNLSSTLTNRGGGGGGGAGGRGLEATSASVGGAGGVGLSGIGDIDFKEHFGLPTSGIGEYIVAENKIYFAGGGGAGECYDGQSGATNYGIGGKGGGSDGKESDNTIEGALPNSGGGGGGGGTSGPSRGHGSNGGSGIVLIRCKIVTSNLNIPTLSSGVITELNKFDQYNTLTFNYDDKYLRYNYYPELSTFTDTANLVAWYKFDVVPTNGATLTNYGSGGTAYNATLNISSSGIERLEGYNAQYRYHWKSDAASGNYISVPGNILQSLYENGHTICFWAKDASTSDNDLTLIATNSGAGDVYIRINTPWSNNNVFYDNGNGTGPYKRVSIASGISANQLVFWTFTRENISSTQIILKVYRDGIHIASLTDTRYDYNTSSASSIFAIGYNMPTINSDFVFQNKSLEDFRIYDRALRHEEIEQLHLEYTNNKLHAHYKFNDPSNLAIDSSSNSYNGNVYGTPEHILPDTISFNVGDGSQYLLFPTDVIKDSGVTREELTFSIWVNKQESNTGYVTYFGIDNDTDTNLSKTIFFGQSSSGSTYIHVRYGSSIVNINTAYDNREIDVWNHYVLVLRKDGSNANIKFYVNGTEYTAYNSNVAWIELDDNLKINRWMLGTLNDNISKYIRDFRIYNTSLSASQIRYIYKSSSSVYNQSKYTLQFDTDTECDFLIVAGGGGGCGNNNYHAGGGGGAGELLEKYNITFAANTQYTIIVGNGGLGQPVKTSPAIEGYDSGIYTGTYGDTPFYHSKGGGRGGNGYYPGEHFFDATSGGSGGGAGMNSGLNNNVNGLSVKYNADGRGHDGKISVGLDAGSGGGAGSIGEYASSSLGQAQSLPGKGYTSYITGEAVTYASGGYGGWQYSRNTANAGKGSGGWGYGGPQGQAGFPGGNGTDGVVIIRYKYVNTKPDPTITFSMNSWTYTDDGNVYYVGNVGIGLSSPTERLDVDGSITGNTKSFKIQHPLNNTTYLYHGNIECPRYDNLYRGRATIVGGTCIVNIDSECNDTGGLIEGTFDALNTDSQLYLQNNQTFDNVKGTIENGKIYIECENTEDEITINWIVIAERKDTNILKLNNTDTAGKLICEHFK